MSQPKNREKRLSSKTTSKTGTKTKSSGKDFEKSLAELEKIVERMEDGDQTLDACLMDFERGMMLSRACAESLKDAEQRVEMVVKKHKSFAIEAFDTDSDPVHNEDSDGSD